MEYIRCETAGMPADQTFSHETGVHVKRQNLKRGDKDMAINYIGVVTAAVAAWVFGAIWYTALGKQWTAALGWTDADMHGPDGKRAMPMAPMIITFVAELVMAFLLAGLMGHFGGATIRTGAIVGVLCWLAFIATTIASNNAFQKRKLALTIIDGGHWLVVLLIEGIVIGAFG